MYGLRYVIQLTGQHSSQYLNSPSTRRYGSHQIYLHAASLSLTEVSRCQPPHHTIGLTKDAASLLQAKISTKPLGLPEYAAAAYQAIIQGTNRAAIVQKGARWMRDAIANARPQLSFGIPDHYIRTEYAATAYRAITQGTNCAAIAPKEARWMMVLAQTEAVPEELKGQIDHSPAPGLFPHICRRKFGT